MKTILLILAALILTAHPIAATPTPTPAVQYEWKIGQDEKGFWHWKRYRPRKETLGWSSIGFSSREDCITDAKKNGLLNSEIHER